MRAATPSSAKGPPYLARAIALVFGVGEVEDLLLLVVVVGVDRGRSGLERLLVVGVKDTAHERKYLVIAFVIWDALALSHQSTFIDWLSRGFFSGGGAALAAALAEPSVMTDTSSAPSPP